MVDFVVSLLGREIKSEQINLLEEGDCMEVGVDSRCLILEGGVKVTGVGGRNFALGEGSILFIHPETI